MGEPGSALTMDSTDCDKTSLSNCQLTSTKTFLFTDSKTEESLNINIPEVVEPSYGMYVWPSAPVLAQYIWFNRHRMEKKCVLELGAGTALAGIVAAKVGSHVTLSDANEFPACLANCQKSCEANDLHDVKVIGVTWGEFSPDVLELGHIDLILGSDCFYDTKDFEDIMLTVSYLLDKNPGAEFWTSYQVRSSERSVVHLLKKFGLAARLVPLADFDADTDSIAQSCLPGDHTIEMYIITKPSNKT